MSTRSDPTAAPTRPRPAHAGCPGATPPPADRPAGPRRATRGARVVRHPVLWDRWRQLRARLERPEAREPDRSEAPRVPPLSATRERGPEALATTLPAAPCPLSPDDVLARGFEGEPTVIDHPRVRPAEAVERALPWPPRALRPATAGPGPAGHRPHPRP